MVRSLPGRGLIVYRVVRSNDKDSDAFVDSFKSNAALGKPPRPNSPEQEYVLVHRAISVFERRYQAEAMARQFPALGDFVATLRLPGGVGFCTARWGSEGHMSLWGESLTLAQCAVDIVRLTEEGDND